MSTLPGTAATPTPPPIGSPLVVRTHAIPDPGALLSLLPVVETSELVSWVRHREGLVGWGRAASFEVSGADRFELADAWWRGVVSHAVVRDEVRLPGSGPVVFGSLPFADDSAEPGLLVVPEVVVGRRGDRWWVTTIGHDAHLPPIPLLVPGPAPSAPSPVAFSEGALTRDAWKQAVSRAVARISNGDLDKVVLARDLQVHSASPIDARWVLGQLAERYQRTWTFAVGGLVGATPELLVRRDQGLVLSRVLAGTIRRTGDDTRDLALAASLARSSKDLEEHEYAVRSVAESLAPHCSSMNVPETPFVLHLSNVMHLATDVAGVAADHASSLALAASLHPTAAVGGTPASLAVPLIAELEGMDRGRYAGPVGWMDASGDGEWGIALRCGRFSDSDPGAVRLFAGCGIVAGSDPDAEAAEAEAKFLPMRDALTAT
ncbi:MAG TPA: isochorismate synthase [Lapillicoccus sp.]|nr:isochorismate synthase [Lapillicoccus sp.]